MEQNQNNIQFYTELIQNPTKLSQGAESITNNLLKNPNFGLETFSLLLEPEIESQQKHFIGTLIKRPLLKIWNAGHEIISEQKNGIRESLLHALIQNVGDLKVIETISILMGEMIKIDGIQIWLDPIKEIIGWMQSSETSDVTDTSLELFCNLFQILEKILNPIVGIIMPVLFQKFAEPSLTEIQREKLLVLLYLIVTSFSYADGINNQLVKMCFDETYELWMSLFISALNSTPKSHVNIKRYILKILTVIFRDFTYYSRKSIIPCLNPIWTFFNKILPLYCWNICYDIPVDVLDENTLQPPKDYKQTNQNQNRKQQQEQYQSKIQLDFNLRFLNNEDEADNDIESLTLTAIELVGTIVTKEQLYMVIKFAVFPIINALSHLMIMTRKNENLWIQDPNLFVSEDENEISIKSLRNMASKLVFELIEKFGDQATQALMIVSEKFLLNLQEKQTLEMIDNLYKKLNLGDLKQFKVLDFTKEKLMLYVKNSNFECEHVDHIWKRREVGLLLLGDFSDDIIYFTSKHQSSFEISNLIKNLMMEIEDDECIPILQSKALLTITKFSEIIASKNKQLFLPLFKVSTKCLQQDRQLPVRMTASKSLANIAQKLERYNEFLNQNNEFEQYGINNTDIIIDLFDILQHTSEDTVYIVLDTLVALNKLSNKYAPVIAEIGSSHILQIFTLFHSEMVIGRTIIELIQQLTKNKDSYQLIFQAFSPFILDCIAIVNQQLIQNNDLNTLKQSDLTLMGAIFEVTATFVINSDNQCEDLMKLLQPLMNLMVKNQDTNLQVNCTLCLKDFIKVSPQHVINHNLVPEINKVIEKLLEVNKDSSLEGLSQNSGNIIMLTFNNLLKGELDYEILKKVVYKIFRSRMPSIVQSLVLVYARMININPQESVKFLTSFQIENRPALKVLIDKWLLQMPVFRGKNTKNCAYNALIKLFLLKDPYFEQLLVLAYNPSHTNVGNAVNAPFKIFSTLIRGLDTEMAPSRKDKNHIKQAQEHIKNSGDYYNDGERIDTMEDEDDEDFSNKFNDMQENNIKQVEVDLEIDYDEEIELDLQKRLKQGEKKAEGGALGDLEIGSTNYMTEGFAFGQYDDEGEGDESLEDDLIYLKDPYINLETSDMLIKFFEDLAKDDPQYFQMCLKNLLKEDVEKLQKYIKFKGTNA